MFLPKLTKFSYPNLKTGTEFTPFRLWLRWHMLFFQKSCWIMMYFMLFSPVSPSSNASLYVNLQCLNSFLHLSLHCHTGLWLWTLSSVPCLLGFFLYTISTSMPVLTICRYMSYVSHSGCLLFSVKCQTVSNTSPQVFNYQLGHKKVLLQALTLTHFCLIMLTSSELSCRSLQSGKLLESIFNWVLYQCMLNSQIFFSL